MPPVNDNFADALTLSGTSGQVTVTLAGATGEPNEVGWGYNKTVWYRWHLATGVAGYVDAKIVLTVPQSPAYYSAQLFASWTPELPNSSFDDLYHVDAAFPDGTWEGESEALYGWGLEAGWHFVQVTYVMETGQPDTPPQVTLSYAYGEQQLGDWQETPLDYLTIQPTRYAYTDQIDLQSGQFTGPSSMWTSSSNIPTYNGERVSTQGEGSAYDPSVRSEDPAVWAYKVGGVELPTWVELVEPLNAMDYEFENTASVATNEPIVASGTLASSAYQHDVPGFESTAVHLRRYPRAGYTVDLAGQWDVTNGELDLKPLYCTGPILATAPAPLVDNVPLSWASGDVTTYETPFTVTVGLPDAEGWVALSLDMEQNHEDKFPPFPPQSNFAFYAQHASLRGTYTNASLHLYWEFRPPRHRFYYLVPPELPVTFAPPLRQLQRDDGLTSGGLRQGGQNQPRSTQRSLRAYPGRGTYA